MTILTINLLCSTLIFWIAARIYLLPRLHEWKPRTVLLPILLLHTFRHFGLMFLARGATYPGIPREFAYPAAVGDLLAAVLALISIPAVAKNSRSARPLVWLFSIEGTADLIAAITLATVYGAEPYMGPALDSSFLGSCAAGDALHYVRDSRTVLERCGLTRGCSGLAPALRYGARR